MIDQYQTVYDTNVFGVVRVTQTFIDLLKKAPEPRIVNVSTAMAPLNMAADIFGNNYPTRFVVYQSSKAAQAHSITREIKPPDAYPRRYCILLSI